MMKVFKFLLSLLFLSVIMNLSSTAQESTTVTVRALAKDAKFIGTGMDGALITIVETATGDTLASGPTKGGTGDTDRIVKNPIERYEKLSTADAAKFVAEIPLQKPMKVTISADAPQSLAYSQIKVSIEQWLIPGKDIVGDGIILEVPGFAITNRLPKSKKTKTYKVGQSIPIKSHIVMMCGCPTADGGLWDSSEYEIKAQVRKGGVLVKEIPLSFTGKTNLFDAVFTPQKAGNYEFVVYAFHPKTENTGVAKTTVLVE